jgi:DNA-binding transcriptional ArsR family regulator
MASDPIDIASCVALLRALANPARLRIALRLLEGECAVAELETELGVRQPNLSQHLAELREAGLVATRRESRAVFYRLADEGQRRLVGALLHGFGGAGAAVPAATSRPRRRSPQAAVFATVEAMK